MVRVECRVGEKQALCRVGEKQALSHAIVGWTAEHFIVGWTGQHLRRPGGAGSRWTLSMSGQQGLLAAPEMAGMPATASGPSLSGQAWAGLTSLWPDLGAVADAGCRCGSRRPGLGRAPSWIASGERSTRSSVSRTVMCTGEKGGVGVKS